MNLTEIKQTLSEGKMQLTKSLGQNFLHDTNQIGRILAIADLQERELILEIGPGLGALTQHLVGSARQVLAIEKDKRLFLFLQRRFAQASHLTLVHADALDYLREQPRDWTAWKLVSNLPYSVASPVLVELAKASAPPARMVVTLQLEVAERLRADPGQKNYGILSLLVQIRYIPSALLKIPASCFYPAPDVDSACLRLDRRPLPLLEPALLPTFERIVKRSFSQRRKMMLKLLKADWPVANLEAAFHQLGFSLQARAETISLEQFVRLTRLLVPEMR